MPSDDAIDDAPESSEPEEDPYEYHAVEVGAGRSMVFLHDVYASHHEFDDVVGILSDDWRCLNLDLPGHGASSPVPAGMTLTDVAADIAGVIDTFGARPAVVVGHGLGGTLAALVASAHPEVVTTLVLVATDLGAAPVPVCDGTRDFVDSYFPRCYAASFFLEQPGRATAERTHFEALHPGAVGPLASVAAAYCSADALMLDPTRDLSVVVVGGIEDEVVPVPVVEHVAKLYGCPPEFVARCGHMVPIEAPQQLAAVIASHLD